MMDFRKPAGNLPKTFLAGFRQVSGNPSLTDHTLHVCDLVKITFSTSVCLDGSLQDFRSDYCKKEESLLYQIEQSRGYLTAII